MTVALKIPVTNLPYLGDQTNTDKIVGYDQLGITGTFSRYASLPILYASETITRGSALYMKSDGSIGNAIATTLATSNILGFAATDVASGAEVIFDSVFSQISTPLLVSNVYYLSDIDAGAVTNIAPTTPGHYIVQVGIAITVALLQFVTQQIPILIS